MISAIILAKNEELNIARAIKSVNWVDEILVIDDFSTDNTANISQKLGARVIRRKLNNNFSTQRNFGLSKAKNKWVLFIDADEVVSTKLADEIQKNIKNTEANGFIIKRSDIFLSKTLSGGEVGEIKLLRLAKKNKGKWERAVHEHWKIKGSVKSLDPPLLHYSHSGVAQFVNQVNNFSTLHANENLKAGKNSNLAIITFYPIIKFFLNFVLKSGYKDGTHGFVSAVMMSFHSFLSWSKQLLCFS